MKIEPLDLSHQALLSLRFSQLQLDISEYSFANCYLFRKTHEYEVVFGDEVFLKGKTYDGTSYLMPTFDARTYPRESIYKIFEQGYILFPIPEEWLTSFPEPEFQRSSFEEESDYIYKLEKIKELPGRHLSSRRNLIHQFKTLYESTSAPLSIESQNDAVAIVDNWKEQLHEDADKTDYAACIEAIVAHEKLGLKGQVYYVDKKPAGCMIGEALNHRMF